MLKLLLRKSIDLLIQSLDAGLPLSQAKVTSKMVKYKPTTVTIDIKSAKKIS